MAIVDRFGVLLTPEEESEYTSDVFDAGVPMSVAEAERLRAKWSRLDFDTKDPDEDCDHTRPDEGPQDCRPDGAGNDYWACCGRRCCEGHVIDGDTRRCKGCGWRPDVGGAV